MSPQLIARAQVVAAAFLFSTGGMAVKSCQLTGWQIASFRSGLAALAILVMVPAARRRPTPRVALVGLAYASTLVLYALANKLTTAANAIFLQSTAPLYVLLLGPLLLGERNRRRDLVLGGVIAAGLVLVVRGTSPATEVAASPFLGNFVAVGTGFCWGMTVLGLRWLSRGAEGMAPAAVAVGNGFAFLLALPMALPVAEVAPSDALWVIYLGVFQVALAYVFLTAGLRRTPAFEASLLLLVEPVFNPLWALWAHGEVPGAGVAIGGLAILGAAVVKTWYDSRSGRRLDAETPKSLR